MKFSEINLDLNKYVRIISRKVTNRENRQDIVYNCYLELLEQNREYNNEDHAIAALKHRINTRRRNKMLKDRFEHVNDVELIDESNLEMDVVSNIDTQIIYNRVKNKSNTLAKVFEALIDFPYYKSYNILSKEIGMSENSFKVNVCHLRKFLNNEY